MVEPEHDWTLQALHWLNKSALIAYVPWQASKLDYVVEPKHDPTLQALAAQQSQGGGGGGGELPD